LYLNDLGYPKDPSQWLSDFLGEESDFRLFTYCNLQVSECLKNIITLSPGEEININSNQKSKNN
jgi:hypothetical protein